MRKNKIIWNYIDMFIQTIIIFIIIASAYVIAENLEKFIYRYTIFPFVACALIFLLGTLLGRGIERTRVNKPIGLISRKMAELRRKRSVFVFSDDGATYTPNKEIIDDLKSGEIVHVKQFVEDNFDIDDFDDIYTIKIDDIVDTQMEEDKENIE